MRFRSGGGGAPCCPQDRTLPTATNYIYIYIYIYICIHIMITALSLSLCTYTYIHIYIHMYTYNVYLYIHAHLSLHTYIYIYIYIHTHPAGEALPAATPRRAPRSRRSRYRSVRELRIWNLMALARADSYRSSSLSSLMIILRCETLTESTRSVHEPVSSPDS